MRHELSDRDRAFLERFESGRFLEPLGHREHLRLAYIYLVDHSVELATDRMRLSIRNFLRYRSIDSSKYHETMTSAWMMAVRHFMEISKRQYSFQEFITQNDRLLDSRIMWTHYSEARLLSERARSTFLEPDLDPIPRYL